jgi:hypothetical protein
MYEDPVAYPVVEEAAENSEPNCVPCDATALEPDKVKDIIIPEVKVELVNAQSVPVVAAPANVTV